MTEDRPEQKSKDCNPPPPNPADQPHPPDDKCDPWTPPNPPDSWKPPDCPKLPCDCPDKPPADDDCLQKAISDQAQQIAAAERAKTFKADLEALLAKAKSARQEYTRDKYEKLRNDWKKQDDEIAALIRKLVCALHCWKCIIECYICPLLNSLRDAEQWLYGDGELYTEFHSLYDERYWWERELDSRQRRFDAIKSLLAAWEKPAQTIEKALADDSKLIAEAGKTLGTDAPKAVYDVFLKLIPMHLAIAPPPKGSKWTTAIGKEYTQFCDCDKDDPKYCCGPAVDGLSLRRRLINPQPYLIDPSDYLDLICCLVKNRYTSAKDSLAEADAKFKEFDAKIQRYKTQIENGFKSFDKDARAAIPSGTECCGDKLKKDDEEEQQPAAS